MEWVFGAIGFGLPLLQTHTTHQEAIRQADLHHDRSIRLDIELARRDILQEMRDQKAGKLETLMVLDTLMLGCCFAIVVEGMPPRNTWKKFLTFFSIFLASSFCMFFLSVWFVRKTQSRMTRYNIMNPSHTYICGKVHPTFHSYYHCHCSWLHHMATMSYYSGVILIIVTASMLFYARYMLKHRVPAGAIIFASINLFFLVSLIFLEMAFPSGPHLNEKDFQGHYSLRATYSQHFKKQQNQSFSDSIERSSTDIIDTDLKIGNHLAFLEKHSSEIAS